LREIGNRTLRPARHIGEPDITSEIIASSGVHHMRNRIMLLTAAVLLTACADDQHATAPASSHTASSRAAGDLGLSAPGASIAGAKPIDQVGFTKVAVLYGNSVTVAAGANGIATITCPAGSLATGGGFELGLSGPGPIPIVWRSHGTTSGSTADGWIVTISNQQAGAVTASVQAWVSCAS
jgi:hypothetical protein